jgi:membrane protein YdbS with pleckstrin-like domain
MTPSYLLAAVLALIAIVVATLSGMIGWIPVVTSSIVVFVILWLIGIYRRLSLQFRLTTHRLLLRKGILSRSDDRILLVDIDDITIDQNVIERMLGVGTITLNTTDRTTKDKSKGEGVLTMKGIDNPRHVGDLIDDARRAERTRRGLYMINT